MRDGPLRFALKRFALWIGAADLAILRAALRLRGEPRYRLAGACGGCARCCEAPSIRVGRITWYLRSARALFLAWQKHVNGFELVERLRPERVFVFRCTHFDPTTRRCDSYASRPLLCRDYPRVLLHQPWPDLFDECGYRPEAKDGAALREALARSGLDPARVAEIRRRLFL